MSMFTRDVLHSADSSPHGLNVGTLADPVRLTWGEVRDRAAETAGGLAGNGIGRHGSVAVLAARAVDVAPLAQAIWMRGAALTMLQQPTPRADLAVWLDDTVRAIRMIRADLVVVGEPFGMAIEHLAAHGVPVCTVDSLRGQPIDPVDTDEGHIALRQLTSGSVGIPKAVEISHANLAANAASIAEALSLDVDADVMLSWLPLSHDMGMIAFICLPMQLGIEAVVVTSDQFLRRPIVWAELISRYRATITSGPNFAYSILARVLERADARKSPEAIDLSSLRIACNGAEPVDHRDVEYFSSVGARFGLSPTAPMPSYGLAEATLAVSFHAHDEPPVVDTVSRRSVSEAHRAQPVPATDNPAAHDPADVQHIVCLGPPLPGMGVRITRDAMVLGPREIGAIQLRGAAIAGSYLTADGVTPLAGDDGWFDTGDLGYLDEQGRVYVCGRTKDVIVLAGVNLYPHDIERAAATVEGVRKGCVIAVRVVGCEGGEREGAEREGFAVLAEVHDADEEAVRLRISRDIAARVNRHVGHAPREVRLFPPGTLPKTSSGKLRRTSARALL